MQLWFFLVNQLKSLLMKQCKEVPQIVSPSRKQSPDKVPCVCVRLFVRLCLLRRLIYNSYRKQTTLTLSFFVDPPQIFFLSFLSVNTSCSRSDPWRPRSSSARYVMAQTTCSFHVSSFIHFHLSLSLCSSAGEAAGPGRAPPNGHSGK